MKLLAVGIIATVIAFATVEGTVRYLHPEATRYRNLERLAKESASSTRWARPDAEFHHVGDGGYKLRFPDPSESQTNRLMIVGDSFALGHGVGEQYRFGTLLQQNVGPKTKVDTLATSSYSPIIYRNIVRRALSLAHYSTVLVFVDQTDPVNDFAYRLDLVGGRSAHTFDVIAMREREDLFTLTYKTMIEKFHGVEGLVRRSATVNAVFPVSLPLMFPKSSKHYRYVQLFRDYPHLMKTFELEPDSQAARKMESLLFQHVDEIVTMCRTRNIHLFLTGNPWEYQVSREPRTVQVVPGPYPRENRLEDILRKRYGTSSMVTVIPMTGFFRKQPAPSLLFLDSPINEIHWNREGHAVVAKVLNDILRASGRVSDL